MYWDGHSKIPKIPKILKKSKKSKKLKKVEKEVCVQHSGYSVYTFFCIQQLWTVVLQLCTHVCTQLCTPG